VYLYVNNPEDLNTINFRFENENLIHTLESSIKFDSIEKYIDDIV